MIKLIGLLFLTGLTFGALSEVAFTSHNEMMKNPMTVIKNEVIKNTNPTEKNKQCLYFRDWVGRYNFNKSKEHHIFYFVYQCLDNAMEVIRSVSTFGYNKNRKESHTLPEGCVQPTIEVIPKNPCHNGFALGEDIIKDVTTLVTKKLVDHPGTAEVNEEVEGIVDPKDLDKLKVKLPELAEILEKVMEDEHKNQSIHIKPFSVETLPNGNIKEVYKLVDGEQAIKVIEPSGATETTLTQEDGITKIIQKPEDPEDATIVVLKDHNDRIIEKQVITPIRHGWERVETYDKNSTLIPPVEERPIAETDLPPSVHVPYDVQKNFDEAADLFSSTLEKFVESKVECFSENIINVQDNYLTFVCATKGHASIKAALRARFGRAVTCGHDVDCDAIEEELENKMLHAMNHGLPTEDIKVGSDESIKRTLITKDQG